MTISACERTLVTLAVIPDSSWTLTSWSANCTITTATTCTTPIYAAKTVTTSFENWYKLVGNNGNDDGRALTTDGSGNVYLAGSTDSDLFGDSNNGNYDAFIVKYNAAGLEQWHKLVGTAGFDYARALATDSLGNVYLAGSTDSNLFGDFNNGGFDSFIVKYNSAGVEQWHKLVGTANIEQANALATDSLGNVYLAGNAGSDLFGDSNNGLVDGFIVKYNSAGVEQWHKLVGTTSIEIANALATDSTGNVYLAGRTDGDLFGNTNNGYQDAFIVKYNAAGVQLWHKLVGTANIEQANALATDSLGNVYLAGNAGSDLFGDSNNGLVDGFIVKYNSAGVEQWHKLVGTTNNDQANALATDSAGNVYLAGITNGDLFGDSNNGIMDAFTVKYNAAGLEQWHKLVGTTSYDLASALATDRSDNVLLAGSTQGDLFGNSNNGIADAFIVKY